MAVGFSNTNKPLNPRGQDASPKGYNRAKLFSGKALDFDGVNDYVDIGQNLGFLNTGDFTLLANAKFDVLSGDEPIMGQGSGSTGSAVLALVNALGKLRFAFYGDDLDWDEPIQTGKWYSLAFTFNRTTKARAIYVNGQLAVSDVTTLTPNASGNTFVIGKVPYLSTYADAQTTGVKAFNTALTATQIADLYNNPEKVVPTGVDNTALKLWLPMQEGAGTTAYDGSGNGNHGTISGATYVHGIGAPVAQTAVIDWNKGTNFFDDSSWLIASATTNGTISSSSHSAPNGVDTAFIYNEGTGTTFNRGYKASNTGLAVGEITASTFVKKKDVDYINVVLGTEGGTYKFYALVDLVNGTIVATDASPTATSIKSVGDGWYYVSVQATNSSLSQGLVYVYGQDPTNTTSVDINYTGTSKETYIWGINIQEGAINNVHLPTIGTLQSSDVLLPQGLTTGRDITGVNLFENVRKQGALNLDGNSWAEVHDNESLDITSAITLECWINSTDKDQYHHIISKNKSADANYAMLTEITTGYLGFELIGGEFKKTDYNVMDGNWNHVVVTYDETNLKFYVNGALDETIAYTSAIPTNSVDVYIGARPEGVQLYEADIAQPRIYNRALTAEEVQRNYNAGKNIYTN